MRSNSSNGNLAEHEDFAGKPSLANVAVLDKVVRNFVFDVFQVKIGFQQGLAEAKQPLVVIEDLARKAGDIIMGRDPAYESSPCNSSYRLGSIFRVLIPNHIKHYGDPGTGAFMWLANQAMQASSALDAGQAETEVQEKLGEVIEDFVSRLMPPR